MSKTNYKVDIEIFEGPLDLLLHLIRLNEVDITDIPIAEITKQYLEYIQMMESLDFEVAGDFLVLSASLIRIKARMLLPDTEFDEEDEEWEDPRKELVERLLNYKKFKELSYHLNERLIKQQNTYSRNFILVSDEYKNGVVDVVDSNFKNLLSAYHKLLSRLSNRIPEEIEGEQITIEEKENYIVKKLKFVKFVRFSELFVSAKSKQEIVVTMMAVLEMIKLGDINVQQQDMFGEIYIYSNEKEEDEQDGNSE